MFQKSQFRTVAVLSCLIASLFASACQDDMRIGSEVIVESSRRRAPKWIKQVPKQSLRYYYFVGKDSSYQQTDRYAYQDALSNLSAYLSTRSTSLYKKIEETHGLEEAKVLRKTYIQNLSRASISGAIKKDVYWEKVEKLTREGIKPFYRYYVLLAIRKKALRDSEARTLREQSTENRTTLKHELEAIQERLAD